MTRQRVPYLSPTFKVEAEGSGSRSSLTALQPGLQETLFKAAKRNKDRTNERACGTPAPYYLDVCLWIWNILSCQDVSHIHSPNSGFLPQPLSCVSVLSSSQLTTRSLPFCQALQSCSHLMSLTMPMMALKSSQLPFGSPCKC